MRFIFSDRKVRIWARNSYLTEDFVPLKSDLDLTILFTKIPSVSERRKFTFLYRSVRGLFPALGEINAYLQTDIEWLNAWTNSFEIQRDPNLAKLLLALEPVNHPTPVRQERAEGQAYLLRMIFANSRFFSDKGGMDRSPLRRQKKWQSHLRRIGIVDVPTPITFDRLLQIAASGLNAESTAENKKDLRLFLQTQGKAGDLPGWLPAQATAFLWCAFPNHLCYSFPQENLCFSSSEIDLMRAQLAWEISGLYSQMIFWKDIPNLLEHLKNLKQFIICMAEREDSSFILFSDAISFLESRTRLYHCSEL